MTDMDEKGAEIACALMTAAEKLSYYRGRVRDLEQQLVEERGRADRLQQAVRDLESMRSLQGSQEDRGSQNDHGPWYVAGNLIVNRAGVTVAQLSDASSGPLVSTAPDFVAAVRPAIEHNILGIYDSEGRYLGGEWIAVSRKTHKAMRAALVKATR